MPDEIRRQAIARDLARQHQLCGIDELRVIDLVTGRLLAHRERHGPLDLADAGGLVDRLGAGITRGDILDSAVSLIARELAAEDAEREQGREAARVEMFSAPAPRWLPADGPGEGGPVDQVAAQRAAQRERRDSEFAPDQQLTRVGGPEPYEVEIEEIDEDPGPHTHVLVGTSGGDECVVCGEMREQFADLADEWDVRGGEA